MNLDKKKYFISDINFQIRKNNTMSYLIFKTQLKYLDFSQRMTSPNILLKVTEELIKHKIITKLISN